MKNKTLARLFTRLWNEIRKLPASDDKFEATKALSKLEKLVENADADDKYVPAGKVVIRDEKGNVIGLQG